MSRTLGAISAAFLMVTLMLAATSASAATVSLDFAGTVGMPVGGMPFNGTLTLDLPQPPTPSGGAEAWNRYYGASASYTFQTIDGHTYSGSSSNPNVGFIRSTSSANSFGAPYVALNIDFPVDGFFFVLLSANPIPPLPLITFDTMPKTLAAWVTTFGPLNSKYPPMAANMPGYTSLYLSSYSLAVAPAAATTPIPASLLMFGTSLVAMGAAAARRCRAGRKVSGSVTKAA